MKKRLVKKQITKVIGYNVNGEAVIEFPVEKGGEKDQVTFVYEGKGALNLRKLILK